MEVVALFLIILAILCFMAVKIMKANEIQMENRMTETYMEYMNELYGVIQERIEATRRYRHDLAKHIQTLEYLCQNDEEEITNLRSYMDGLKGSYQEITGESFCSDEIVNSIIAIKKQQCKNMDIPIEIYVRKNYHGKMKEIDVVSLLHNLFDNAIEANERIQDPDKKGISFYMEKEDNIVDITIQNYVNPKETIDFQTKKKEKNIHGIGMGIIQNIVDKYHGTITVELDDKEHILKQHISLKEGE